MRHWQKLAALLLATACSGDATAPDPATVEPEPPTPPANRAPVATADSIPAVHLPGPGEAVAVAVGAYFTDPDGDALTFAAASTDTAIVSAAVAGDTVRLTGGGNGGAGTVTVTAADPAGLSARVAVAVAVNRAPVLSGEIPAQSLIDGAPPEEVDVSAYFTDPDGDALAFEASSTDTAVVRVALSGTALTFEVRAVGEAAVTVTASDPDSLEARAVFTVEVTENPDRAALVALYEATDGPNWKNNENWLTDAPLSEWHGVDVSDDGVRGLSLDRNALSGPVPPELGDLTNLKTLSLSDNALTGPIPPELGNLASLSFLGLGCRSLPSGCDNELTGPIPPELGNLASLGYLSLAGNALTGPIPPELGNLATLRSLYLHYNALTGPIPPELGDLTSLITLSLSDNALTGPIPPELGNLASLETLQLQNNELTGPIPGELGNLANLWSLGLGCYGFSGGGCGNELSGPIPPELANLARLEHLSLDNNVLTGPIPPELANLARLRTLRLHYNALSGPIPPELANFVRLRSLSLSDNALTGPIPVELANLASLQRLWLGNNALSGPIPVELATSNLQLLGIFGNPELCAPADPQFRAWLIEVNAYPYPCRSNPNARLLPLVLMREDGNGLSLPLPDDLRNPAVSVSDPGVVAADARSGLLVLEPRSIGRADVELVPSDGGFAAVAGVVVREAVGTFGIDIVMEQPVPLTFDETMVAAVDWWSSVLDGTELWEDRATTGCSIPARAYAVTDGLLIHAAVRSQAEMGRGVAGAAQTCFSIVKDDEGREKYIPQGGTVTISEGGLDKDYILRHEIGHVLGLVLWRRPKAGLVTENRAYFIGPRAVEEYRAGGGDPGLPGIPIELVGGHWHRRLVGAELMGPVYSPAAPDAISLAALADAGYTVDMTKATPWRKVDNAAAAGAGEPFRERVEVRIVPRPVPE